MYNPFTFNIFKIEERNGSYFVIKRRHFVFWFLSIYAKRTNGFYAWSEELSIMSADKFADISTAIIFLNEIKNRSKATHVKLPR